MQLQSKAWVINPQRLSEPWFCPDNAYYGDNVGQVKSKALRDINGLTNHAGDEFTWLTVPLIRAKSYDRYLVEGKIMTMVEIEREKAYEDRRVKMNALMVQNPDAKTFIRKGGRFYRANRCGYTDHRIWAGVYTIQEAVSEVLACSIDDGMDVEIIDIERHNREINQEIEELKSRLIPTNKH